MERSFAFASCWSGKVLGVVYKEKSVYLAGCLKTNQAKFAGLSSGSDQ